MVVGDGFEPSKAEPTDLQSAAFDRFAIPPQNGFLTGMGDISRFFGFVQSGKAFF